MLLMGSFWGYVLIYPHLSLLVCEMRSSTLSGLLSAHRYRETVESVAIWEAIPSKDTFYFDSILANEALPNLVLCLLKTNKQTGTCYLLHLQPHRMLPFHFPSTWSLIQLLRFSQREQCPRLQSISLLSCLFTQNTPFPLHSYFIWPTRLDHHLNQKFIPTFRRVN